MNPGQSFQAASAAVVSRFANKGTLLQPVTDIYDPITGDQSLSNIPHTFEYVTVSNKTLEKEAVDMVAGIRQSVIWFTFPAEDVDTTWSMLPISASGIPEQAIWKDFFDNIWYDEVEERWIAPFSSDIPTSDIVQLERVVVNDIVVGYYALLEYQGI